MKLIEMTLKTFIDEVDSGSPAPGGGSVSGLVSTLGVSLSKMVSHLTFNKRQYLAFDEEVRSEYEANFNTLNKVKEKLIPLVDKDTEAFNLIMEAFRLPRTTDEEKVLRSKQIESATIGAIEVPLEIVKLSYQALKIIGKMVTYGNKNALSDIGVGCLLLYAGLEGAIFNVKINLNSLTNETDKTHFKDTVDVIQSEAIIIKDRILKYVNKHL
jgi:formiminotetrahydrofolate cyclodeaminase